MRNLTVKTTIRRFMKGESGATAIEYALIASGVSIAILGAISMLGTKIMTAFYDSLTNLF